MKRFLSDLRYWSASLRDLLFPRRCIVCDSLLRLEERHLCATCLDDIPLTYFWSRSPNPAETLLRERCCCVAAASLYFYRREGGYSHIIHELKYKGQEELGLRFGHMLGEYLLQCGRFEEIQAIVPVPLHPLRRWKRGYNQAEAIARGISAAMGVPVVTDLLHRRRRTSTQTRLGHSDRAKNVKGAFTMDIKKAGLLEKQGIRNILVVDDVLTTGATLSESLLALENNFHTSAATLGYAGE